MTSAVHIWYFNSITKAIFESPHSRGVSLKLSSNMDRAPAQLSNTLGGCYKFIKAQILAMIIGAKAKEEEEEEVRKVQKIKQGPLNVTNSLHMNNAQSELYLRFSSTPACHIKFASRKLAELDSLKPRWHVSNN